MQKNIWGFMLLCSLYLSSYQFLFSQVKIESQYLTKCAPQLLKNPDPLKELHLKVKDLAAFQQWYSEAFPKGKVIRLFRDHSSVIIGLKKTFDLEKILENRNVVFVDRAPIQAQEERANDPLGFQINRISAIRSLFPQWAGQNQRVSIKERAFDPQDIDFRGRVGGIEDFEAEITTHATSMASLVAGGGNSSYLGLGVAPKAILYTANFANLMPDEDESLAGRSIWVQNHSYGVAIENYYGIETEAYDAQVYQNPRLLHVFSAGNSGSQASPSGPYTGIEGFANLTAQFKMSKNTLSVGETNAERLLSPLSSRGPAYDGRVKPEITAYGGAGSSESAALVSGASLLIQQAYQEKEGEVPSSDLVKASLINSANDLGRAEVDFEYGYGQLDALGALKSIEQGNFWQSNLAPLEEEEWTINVPSSAQKLKITLVWHDPPASLNAAQALMNDLDLSLIQVGTGREFLPWVLNSYPHPDSLRKVALRQKDHLNNIEQITLDNPTAGEYTIRVKSFELSNNEQPFSLVYEFGEEEQWLYPLENDFLNGGEEILIEWKSYQTGPGYLEYRFSESEEWQEIQALSSLSVGQYSWLLPDTLALVEIRVRSNEQILSSGELFINQPIIAQVGFDCEEELMLFWSPVKGIEEYRVYSLGEESMDLVVQVSDTLIVLAKEDFPTPYFAVEPIFQSQRALGPSINYEFQSLDCYFRSVFVEDFLADTTRILGSLGSTYGLSQIRLERKNDGVYQSIQVLEEPLQTHFSLKDKNPQAYGNTYRVALQDQMGRVFYSNELESYYVPEGELILFPNPSVQGEEVLIIDKERSIERLQVFDNKGSLIWEYAPDFSAEFSDIPIPLLLKGLYFVRIYLDNGANQVKRLVID